MCNSLVLPPGMSKVTISNKETTLCCLQNPLSSDLNAMRQIVAFWRPHFCNRILTAESPILNFTEFGHCYFYHKSGESYPKASNYIEKNISRSFISGNTGRQSWNCKNQSYRLLQLKSSVEIILSRLGIKSENLSSGESNKKYYSESSTYLFNNKVVAEAGRVSKSYLSKFDIGQDVYWGHIEWDLLFKMIKDYSINFHELSKISIGETRSCITSRQGIKFGQVRDMLYVRKKTYFRILIFSMFMKVIALAKTKKSYAVSFILRDDLKTMTDKNIDKIMNNLIKAF